MTANLLKVKVLSSDITESLFMQPALDSERIICFVYHKTQLLMGHSMMTVL